MATQPLTAADRDALIARAADRMAQCFPKSPAPRPRLDDFHRLHDEFLVAVADYFDGLPRVVMSACPYCDEPLVRAFDPWGVDGLWWGENAIYATDEPDPCEHFRALLGALRIAESDIPTRMMMTSYPGPEVPFVVPAMLELAGMIAVVGELGMARGGPAYPVAYFSKDDIDPVELHQNWCRKVLWFERDGKEGWTMANDVWDFDLAPYAASGQLRWVRLDGSESPPRVRTERDAERFPLSGLPGEQRPQWVSSGRRTFLELPDGKPVDPFDT